MSASMRTTLQTVPESLPADHVSNATQTMTEKDKRAVEKRKNTMELKRLEAKKVKLLKDALLEADALAEQIETLKKSS